MREDWGPEWLTSDNRARLMRRALVMFEGDEVMAIGAVQSLVGDVEASRYRISKRDPWHSVEQRLRFAWDEDGMPIPPVPGQPGSGG